MKKFLMFIIIVQSSLIDYAQIIADHTVVDLYDDIPQQWIDSVKTKLVWLPGMSHGYGYFRGAELLEQMDARFQVDIWIDTDAPSDQNNALRLGRPGLTRETMWTSQSQVNSVENGTIKEQSDGGNPFDFIWFGWSYQGTWENDLGGGVDPVYNIQWAGSTQGGPDGNNRWGLDSGDESLTGNSVCMDTYLEAVEEYNQFCADNQLVTKFFFSNGVVDDNSGTELGFQRELKNQHIRDYVNSEGDDNTYFLDYADILVYNNSGELNTVNWNDDGTDRPHQQIHPDNLMDYDNNFNIISPGTDAVEDHIGEVGTVRLAKAMWWLLARASGWDGGNTTSLNDELVPDIKIISSQDKIIFSLGNYSDYFDQYYLYDLNGTLLLQGNLINNAFDINLSRLSPDIYIICLGGVDHTLSFKLVIP